VFLLQFPPSFAFEPRRVGRFCDLLRARTDVPVACEPRHASWTTDGATRLLVKFRVARVAADPPRASGLASPGGWPGLVYYRWHGSPRTYFSSYSVDRLDALAGELETAARERTPPAEVFCIFDNTGSGSAAANALDLRALITR